LALALAELGRIEKTLHSLNYIDDENRRRVILRQLLSNRNRALLAQIAVTHPSSLHELATTTGRTPGNLSRTLKTMERYGLVRLHKGERGKLRPEVPYRDVQLDMTLS